MGYYGMHNILEYLNPGKKTFSPPVEVCSYSLNSYTVSKLFFYFLDHFFRPMKILSGRFKISEGSIGSIEDFRR
jgi:hypothetical protein